MIKYTILLFLCVFQLKAQTLIGLRLGLGENNINTTTIFSNQYTKYKGKSTGIVGIELEEKLTEWFSLQSGFFYNEKSYQRYRTGYFKENFQNFTNGFIQLPFTSNFSFGFEKLRGSLIVGIAPEFWVKKRTNGQLYNLGDIQLSQNAFPKGLMSDDAGFSSFNLRVPFDRVTDKRVQIGTILGIEAHYQPSDNLFISIEYRMNNSLTSLVKKYQLEVIPRINNAQFVLIGIKKELKLKK